MTASSGRSRNLRARRLGRPGLHLGRRDYWMPRMKRGMTIDRLRIGASAHVPNAKTPRVVISSLGTPPRGNFGAQGGDGFRELVAASRRLAQVDRDGRRPPLRVSHANDAALDPPDP